MEVQFLFFPFSEKFIISFFFKIPLKCLFEYGPSYSHPSWSNVKENKMSRMKGQCVPTFFDGGLLRKFFSFWGAHKTFFWPSKPYLALETLTLGGSYFQKKDYSFHFWKWTISPFKETNFIDQLIDVSTNLE